MVHLPGHHAEARGDEPDLRRLRRLRSAAAPGRCWPVLGGVGLVLVLLGLRAGARGTVWRLGSLVVVLAALANPSLIEEQRKPIADVALVVVDDTDLDGDRRAPPRRSRRRARR